MDISQDSQPGISEVLGLSWLMPNLDHCIALHRKMLHSFPQLPDLTYNELDLLCNLLNDPKISSDLPEEVRRKATDLAENTHKASADIVREWLPVRYYLPIPSVLVPNSIPDLKISHLEMLKEVLTEVSVISAVNQQISQKRLLRFTSIEMESEMTTWQFKLICAILSLNDLNWYEYPQNFVHLGIVRTQYGVTKALQSRADTIMAAIMLSKDKIIDIWKKTPDCPCPTKSTDTSIELLENILKKFEDKYYYFTPYELRQLYHISELRGLLGPNWANLVSIASLGIKNCNPDNLSVITELEDHILEMGPLILTEWMNAKHNPNIPLSLLEIPSIVGQVGSTLANHCAQMRNTYPNYVWQKFNRLTDALVRDHALPEKIL